ncbi:STAS domain-containing protein [Terriglobus albidus]|uniref:STAS domain-containing protein n=1 Tax=Terriglobus albidus TaxID=1592106 RepID=UPI0021E03D6B|nr:STAS domain-containing protein [Terriglobus albidus]
MSIRKRAVNILQLPGQISVNSHADMLRRLKTAAQNGHPRFVLDCSKIETMGTEEIQFLLCCLEEVMKHNGDVRLATVTPEARTVLQNAGISRLFEIYGSIESAIHSYQVRPASMAPLYTESAETHQDSEYAA